MLNVLAAPRFRAMALTSWLVLACGFLLWILDTHQPIGTWLFLWIARDFSLSLAFFWGATGLGLAILRVSKAPITRLDEKLLIGTAVGVFVVYHVIVFAGLADLLGTFLFVGLPLTGMAAGWTDFLRLMRVLCRLKKLRRSRTISLTRIGGYTLLTVGGLMFFLLAINPSNLGYDAHWYHFAIGEQYTIAGGIERFQEGWYLGAYPQLWSILVTWAFLSPWGGLVEHVTLGLMLEFFIIALTVLFIPVVVRRTLGAPVPLAVGAFLFLFPGMFLYDSSLTGYADHVLGFWGLPTVLCIMRYRRTKCTWDMLLVATCLSAGLTTKYQGVYLVAVAVVMLVPMLWSRG